jgi:DnaJ family protein C protein 17
VSCLVSSPPLLSLIDAWYRAKTVAKSRFLVTYTTSAIFQKTKMSSSDDLLKWTTSDVDFYDLLGLSFENYDESGLNRAFRKTALKYHPDKAGKNYDEAKYQLFTKAYEVLKDPAAKEKYDNHRNAKLQKRRADELFEGKRRLMKEDLEARERGGVTTAGVKRPWEDDTQQQEIRRLAEEGRKRRAARASMMGESIKAEARSSPAPRSPEKKATPSPAPAPKAEEDPEDDIVRLERKIREAEEAKAKRKAEKRARKSGIFVPADSPSVGGSSQVTDRDTATPIKRPDLKGLKADETSSASPKFSFSPNTPKLNDFSATMARLKAAEKQRLEDEIKKQEAEMA